MIKVSQLPEPCWYKYEINSKIKVIFNGCDEVSMGNDLSNMAIVEGDTVLYNSNVQYHGWEEPIILEQRFMVVNYSRFITNTPAYSFALSLHVFDFKNFTFTRLHEGRTLGAGGYIRLKNIEAKVEEQGIWVDGFYLEKGGACWTPIAEASCFDTCWGFVYDSY
jgi:hypothetical protein